MADEGRFLAVNMLVMFISYMILTGSSFRDVNKQLDTLFGYVAKGYLYVLKTLLYYIT